MRSLIVVLLVVASAATTASAQDAPEVAPPETWTEFDVVPATAEDELIEDAATIKALLAGDMETRHALTPSARDDLVQICARLGYQLVDIEFEEPGGGVVRAILRLAPRLIVRRVDVKVDRWSKLYIQDAIVRRMGLRVGEVIEVEKDAKATQLNDEAEHLRRFLQDEGFFEAKVGVTSVQTGVYGALITVRVTLGPDYHVGVITIDRESQLAVSGREIRAIFSHCRLYLFGKCRLRKRFTRAQHQADITALTELYQRRGYPAVRVQTDYNESELNARAAFNRATRGVDFKVRIDERRRLAVEFEGNDERVFPDDVLRAQLTFDDASAADAFEIANSAIAIQRYYQRKGWFDAAVTWEPERVQVDDGKGGTRSIDQIRYRIDSGVKRTLRAVTIAQVAEDGETPLPESELRAVLATKVASRLGDTAAVTTEQLGADVDRIERVYKLRGYLQAEAEVHVSPTADAVGSAWATAADLAAERGAGDLYVRFDVAEGARTVLDAVEIVFEGAHAATRDEVLAQLAITPGRPLLVDELQTAGQRLQDWYWHLGRPRAHVTLELLSREDDPYEVVATYKVEERNELHVGKVVVRGNFRTRNWVILEELGFREGALLTDTLFTKGVRRLRQTGLFSAVSVELLDFEESRQDTINAIVHVEERNDVKLYVDFEAGVSDQKGLYVKSAPVLPNPFHNGITIATGLTYGLDLTTLDTQFGALEGSMRFPRWVTRAAMRKIHMPRRLNPDAEVSAYWRLQDTDRFGTLKTFGFSIALTRSWQREASPGKSARSIAATLRYDVRRRSRQEDAVRVAGNNGNVSRSTVINLAGSIGLTLSWDQRVDRAGSLNPLAPYKGFKLETGVAIASRFLGSQDAFLKVSGAGQWIRQLSNRVQLRVEGRYDQGIPLGGAVLLPEVERFFAGGDETVRGFGEDRLATEVVEEPVPPFGDLTQVRVLPAGGNIRLLGSIDLQVSMWKVASLPLASALFVDAGAITNTYSALTPDDVRPSAGIALARLLTPFGGLSLEWAVPLRPRDVDPPLGRLHFLIALRY